MGSPSFLLIGVAGSVGRPLGAAICGVSVRFLSERLVGGGGAARCWAGS